MFQELYLALEGEARRSEPTEGTAVCVGPWYSLFPPDYINTQRAHFTNAVKSSKVLFWSLKSILLLNSNLVYPKNVNTMTRQWDSVSSVSWK